MCLDNERHYVLKGTACLNGSVFLGGTQWTGHPSSVVDGYLALSCHGVKLLLDRATVENYFREVEAPGGQRVGGVENGKSRDASLP